MSKRSPKEILKSFSWSYIFLAVIGIILAIVLSRIPAFVDGLKEQSGDENAFFNFTVQMVTSSLIYVWYFWLARRVADGKSNGTVYMVLLIIGVIGGLVSMFAGPTKGVGTVDFALDCVGLWFLLKIRKENA